MSRAPFLKEQDLDAVSRAPYEVVGELPPRFVADDDEQGRDDFAIDALNRIDSRDAEQQAIDEENARAEDANRDEEAQRYDGAHGRWGNRP